jgi:hypothetical protein
MSSESESSLSETASTTTGEDPARELALSALRLLSLLPRAPPEQRKACSWRFEVLIFAKQNAQAVSFFKTEQKEKTLFFFARTE